MRGALLRTAFVCVILSAACGDDEESNEWKGTDPHVSITGKLDGDAVRVNITDSQAEASELRCEREYDLPVEAGEPVPAEAKFVGFEISALVTIDGEERLIEIDIEGPDLQTHVGQKIRVVPDGSDVAHGQAVVEVKMTRLSDEAELLDDDASEGSFTLEHLDGEPGEGGVIVPDGEGAVGLVGEFRFSATDVVKVSLTAACGDNDVQELVGVP